jgi:hypothetical protein
MRTTLILDDDVTAELKLLSREWNAGLPELLNEAIRRGIRQMRTRPKFQTRSVSLGRLLIPSIDDVTEVLAIADQRSKPVP